MIFEDISDENELPNIKVYNSLKGNIKEVSISEEIYEERIIWKWIKNMNKWIKIIRNAIKTNQLKVNLCLKIEKP